MTKQRSDLAAYCLDMSSPVPEYLYRLERATHLHTISPQMIAGPLQGRFLAFLSRMIRPKTILEIGTFTAYSTLCLAEGLAEEGEIVTIEANDENEDLIRDHIALSPYQDHISVKFGKAEEIVPGLTFQPDLIYIDGGKQDYELHYTICMDILKPSAYLLVDNVLWGGKVTRGPKDRDTRIMQEFNSLVRDDPRAIQLFLPVRDGLLLVQKRAL